MPPAAYSVQVYNQASTGWEEAESNLICSDYVENTETTEKYRACTLYIKSVAAPNSKNFMKITKSGALEVKSDRPKTSSCIQSASQRLCFKEEQHGPFVDF